MAGCVLKVFVYSSLFVCLVLAYRETTTKGHSGPACGGNNRRCLKQATCDVKRKMCICPKSFKGNGNLGCVKEEEAAISLQSDSLLKNFFNESITIQTPCPSQLLKYTTPDSYIVEVYADNKLYIGGKYYANRVEVRFFTTDNNYSIIVEGTAEGGVYKFTEWMLSEDKGFNEKASPEDYQHIGGYKVKTTYDTIDNFAIIDAEDGFGLHLRFRPADVTKEFQSQVPGIVITVSEALWYQIHLSPNELSSTPDGPSVVTTAAQNKVSITEWAIYSSMNSLETIESMDRSCDLVARDFQNVCPDKTTRLAAVKACSSIYTDQVFLNCLAKSNLQAGFQADLYALCQAAICQMKYTKCLDLEKMLEDNTKCSPPKGLSFCTPFWHL
ncbi:hypothetical protein Btru_039043 [Bulinus truncatus]|nr:hypothetical protein Btru_039043 [Bulinus truncatus]